MAEYEVYKSGTKGAYGDVPDSTGSATVDGYAGYQIGGNAEGYAQIDFELPYDYNSYDSCVFNAVLYSRYTPSNWYSNWHCIFAVLRNGVLLGGQALILERSDFSTSSGDTVFNFPLSILSSFGINVPVFSPGDTISFIFDGDANTLTNALGSDYSLFVTSGRCLYLCHATLTSNLAEIAAKKNYLVVKSYTPVYVSQYSSGTYYVSWADYRRYWGISWDVSDYMQVTLNGSGGGYYSDVTYYTASQQYLTDGSGRRLYIPD